MKKPMNKMAKNLLIISARIISNGAPGRHRNRGSTS
jgi:hypothetical protein